MIAKGSLFLIFPSGIRTFKNDDNQKEKVREKMSI